MAFESYAVELDANVIPFAQKLDQAARSLDQFTARVDAAGTKASAGMRKTGESIKAVATTAERAGASIRRAFEFAAGFALADVFIKAAEAVKNFATEAVHGAANLQLGLRQNRVIFGENARIVAADVDRLGRSYGANNAQILGVANSIGLVGRAAGLSAPQQTALARSMTPLIANLAAFKNVAPEEVGRAVQRGLLGMTRGLKALGVDITNDMVAQEAHRLGLVRTKDELTEQAKVLARASIISQQLGYATGTLAARHETLAGRVREIRGQFQNWLDQLGMKAIPYVTRLFEFMGKLGHEAMPIVQEALRRLQPFFDGLVSTVGNVWSIGSDLLKLLGPLAGGFLTLAGGAVIGSLDAVATALSDVSGFLATIFDWLGRNQPIAVALGVALLAAFAGPAIIGGITSLIDFLAVGLVSAVGAAEGALTGLVTTEALATGGISLLIGGFAGFITWLLRSSSEAGKWTDATIKRPARTVPELTTKLADLKRELRATEQGFSGSATPEWRARVHALRDAVHQTTDALKHERTAIDEATASQHLSEQQVKGLASSMGIDLTKATGDSADQLSKASQKAEELASKLGLSEQAALDFAGNDVKALEALVTEYDKFTGKVQTSFGSAFDSISFFGSKHKDTLASEEAVAASASKAADKKATATEKAAQREAKAVTRGNDSIAAAETHLAQVQQRVGSKKKTTVSDEQAISNAQTRVADARKRAADAEANAATKQQSAATASGAAPAAKGAEIPTMAEVTDFYSKATTDAQAFVTGISTVIKEGLDPSFVARLLEAGPQQAGPLLEAMVGDHSGRMIKMVNDSEAALQKMSAQTIEIARLTFLAQHSQTDQMGKDLQLAMQVTQQELASGGSATVAQIAQSTGRSIDEIKNVVKEYGITVAGGVNDAYAAVVTAMKTLPPTEQAIVAQAMAAGTQPGSIMARQRLSEVNARAEGAHDAHVASGLRVFGEPETGGEAYIPLSPQKRSRSTMLLSDVAQRFGYSLTRFADGGLHPPPQLRGSYGATASTAMDAAYALAKAAVDAAQGAAGAASAATAAVLGPGGKLGPRGSGDFPEIIAYLASTGVPFTVTSTTGGRHASGSLHGVGRAVDFVGPSMMNIWSAFASVGDQLAELIHSPAPFGIKNGQRVDQLGFYGAETFAGHFGHVHAAYDQGGWLPMGLSMAYNGTGRPEPVGASSIGREVARALAPLLSEMRGGGDTHISVTGSEHGAGLARAIARENSWARR